jgi:hypothetical protein
MASNPPTRTANVSMAVAGGALNSSTIRVSVAQPIMVMGRSTMRVVPREAMVRRSAVYSASDRLTGCPLAGEGYGSLALNLESTRQASAEMTEMCTHRVAVTHPVLSKPLAG